MFFRTNIFSNFGDLGTAVKNLLNNFQKQHQSTKELKSGEASVEDIQKIVDNFPELKKNSNDVSVCRLPVEVGRENDWWWARC